MEAASSRFHMVMLITYCLNWVSQKQCSPGFITVATALRLVVCARPDGQSSALVMLLRHIVTQGTRLARELGLGFLLYPPAYFAKHI